jgi:hypothetical protein
VAKAPQLSNFCLLLNQCNRRRNVGMPRNDDTGPGYVKNTCPRRNVNPTPPSPLKRQGSEASDSNFEDIQPQNRLRTETEPSKTRICDCCNAINFCDVPGTATEWQLISPIFFSELTPERCDVCRFFYSIIIQYRSLTKDNNCIYYFGAGPGSLAIRPKEARGHLSLLKNFPQSPEFNCLCSVLL